MIRAPYRIVRPAAPPPASVRATSATPAVAAGPSKAREIADRAIRLIPGEVLVVYAAIRDLFSVRVGAGQAAATAPDPAADPVGAFMLAWFLPAAGLLLTAGLRIWGSRRPGAGPADIQWGVVVFACLTYCGWVISQGGPVLIWDQVDSRIGAALLILFGAVPPFLYTGADDRDEGRGEGRAEARGEG